MVCGNNSLGNDSGGFNFSERIQHLDALQRETNVIMIPSIVFLCLISTAGVIGNSLVLFVYSCRFSRSAVRTFMMAAAVFDLVINTVVIPAEIYDMFHAWDFDKSLVCRARRFFNAQTTSASGFLLVAIAVTRYRKICRPFNRQVNTREAKLICVAIVLLSGMVGIPHGIINGSERRETKLPNIYGCHCSVDDRYGPTKWPLINSAFLVLLFVTCCSCLVVLYVLIRKEARPRGKPKGANLGMKTTGNEDYVKKPEDSVLTSRILNQPRDNVQTTEESENGELPYGMYHNNLQQNNVLRSSGKDETERPVLLVNENKRNSVPSVSQKDEKLENENRNGEHSSAMLLRDSTQRYRKHKEGMFVISISRDKQDMTWAVTKQNKGTNNTTLGGELNNGDGVVQKNYKGVNNRYDISSDQFEINESKSNSEISSDDSVDIDEDDPTAEGESTTIAATFPTTLGEVRPHSSPKRVASAKYRARRKGRRVDATTWMLLTITFVFFCGFLPFLCLELFKLAAPNVYASMDNVYQSLYHLFRRSICLNSAINPIIYNLCDLSFRKECWKIFKGLKIIREL